jgi:hypothetical protein
MAEVKVGQKYRITYSAENATSVTAAVRHENDSTWAPVALTKEEVGDGYRDIWVGDYMTLKSGWYYVVFKTLPVGGESTTKFRASKTSTDGVGTAVGTIRVRTGAK